MSNECFYCKDTGIIKGTEVVPGDKLPDQICPNCEIGQAVLKGKRMAESVQLAEYAALKASHDRLKTEVRASTNRLKTVLAVLPDDYRLSVEIQINFNKQALKEAKKIGE
ncbi:MAG: hypothetical protein MUO31_13265 [Thermodesulfovibrionales bacterium]|nr:hypothetical protein [Thermodesulfovibrionales bacterium]